MRNKKKLIIGLSILMIFLIIIGVSYAYFTANMAGEESTTITVKGGKMLITYDGGDNITINNIFPDDNPAAIKTFTVTGFNNTEIEMAYKISLVVESNTFSDEALKYKLISENTDNNGEPAPSTELINITSGESIIELGIGSFDVPTDENKTHTYNLELYFSNQDYDQNIEQQKQIKAYILTENYIPPKLGEAILAQGNGTTAIEAKGTPSFSVINGTSGLYASLDEYGMSYYYRGLKTELNNNLIWGGFQWKIVRINGDGSVRLIYNGTEAQFTTNGTVNDLGTGTQIEGTPAWNTTNYNDAKYVGYMYGGANGSASSERFGTTSVSATYNQTKTNIYTVLDDWYKTNIFDKGFGSQVADNLFCNDRQLQSDPGVGGEATGPGYGTTSTTTYYAAYYRLNTTKTPILKCGLQNDQFTTSAGAEVGNGTLTYPVGLLTADEASMAGLVFITGNTTNYLYTNQTWWSFSPYFMDSIGRASVWGIDSSGYLNINYVNNPHGARPLVSLIPTTRVSGTGSATDPFRAL